MFKQIFFLIKFTLLSFIVSSIVSYALFLLNPVEYNGFSNPNIWVEIFAAFILAPVTESIVFFWLIYKIIFKINLSVYNNYLFIAISSILFGLSHFYNINYIIETIVTGLFMAYLYIIMEKKFNNGLISVIIMHSFYNFLVLILNFVQSKI